MHSGVYMTEKKKGVNHAPIKKYFIITVAVVVIIVAAALFLFQADKRTDFARIKEETYNSVFFSMYDISNYHEEDFTTYRGLQTLLAGHTIGSLSELSRYLDKAFQSGNTLSNIYIGFDPYVSYCQNFRNDEIWQKSMLENLFCYLEAHPETTFEILLPYPSLDTWTGYSDKKTNTMLATYQTTVALLSSYPNAVCHFAGAEEWLIANPDNYTPNGSANELISCELLKHVFCDWKYIVDTTNAQACFDLLREHITSQKNSAMEYPDYSDLHLVFFGDSIIGNHNGSYSIPGVIQGLTGANVYNFAIGGTNASRQDNEEDIYPSFITRTEEFLAGTIGQTQDGTEFPYKEIPSDSSDICFIIHYGFNDFMWDVAPDASDLQDITTFKGALYTGITDLKEAYPNATILLAAPQLCTYYAGGDSITNESGYRFDDYITVIETVARETDAELINMPALIQLDETNYTDYYVDSFHHTEQGRFVTANHWINILNVTREIP